MLASDIVVLPTTREVLVATSNPSEEEKNTASKSKQQTGLKSAVQI